MPSLFDQSAVAKLLAQMTGGANLPSADRPQAPDLGGLMAPPIPAPTVPGRSTSPGDASHEHRSGLRGGLLHAVGADRMDPELAALLTPDQQRRVKPGLLATVGNAVMTGQGPRSTMRRRAADLLSLQDMKKQRDLSAQQQAMLGQLRQMASTMEPQQAAEFMARMATVYGLPEYGDIASAAERTRPPQMQARANAKMTVLGDDGNYYAIQQDALGNEVPGSRVRVPKPTSGITYREGVGPDGRPVVYALPSEESGDVRGAVSPRQTGIEVPVPERGDPQTLKLVNNERTLAYDDAINSWKGLTDEGGKIKDPPGNLDRLATRVEWMNWAASDEGQAYMNNVRKLIRSWVVLVEGKRMSDADARVNELQRSFSVGDKSLVVEGKKKTLESMKQSIEALKRDGGITTGGRTITLRNGTTIQLPARTVP